MAVAPAPIDLLTPDSFSGIQMPIAIMNLGRIEELPLTMRADKAARLISHVTYSTIDDASRYRMFAQCKPGAAEIAIAEIGEPICSDGGARSRKDIHNQIINTATDAFEEALRQGG